MDGELPEQNVTPGGLGETSQATLQAEARAEIEGQSPAPTTLASGAEQPTPPVSPAISPEAFERLRKEATESQAELARLRQAQQFGDLQKQVQAETAVFHQDLLNEGVPAERAQTIAGRYQQKAMAEHAVRQQALQGMEFMEGKFNAALHFANVYKVDPRGLMAFNDPASMEREAKTQARIRALEEREALSKKAQVPPQNFEMGQGGSGGVSPSLRALLDTDISQMQGETLAKFQRDLYVAIAKGR